MTSPLAAVIAGGFIISAALGGQARAARPIGRGAVHRHRLARPASIFHHVNGASPDKHLVETMGSGGLFFDYDNDGWLDIFLVDGGSLADPAVARRARHRLYPQSRQRHVRGRDRAVRHPAPRLRDGRVRRRLRQRRPRRSLRHERRSERAVPQRRRRHVHRRHPRGPRRLAAVEHQLRLRRSRSRRRPRSVRHELRGRRRRRTTRSAATHARSARSTAIRSTSSRCRTSSTATTATARSPTSARESGIARFAATASASSSPTTTTTTGRTCSWPTTAMPNFLFRNDGAVALHGGRAAAGVAVATDGKARAGMGTDAADYDGDGRLDLVVTNLDFETHSLYRNLGRRLFAYATAESGIGLGHAALRRLRRGASSTSTTTRSSTWRSSTGTSLDNAALSSGRARRTRSASCCSATSAPRRFGDVGEPPDRVSRWRRSAAAWRPATSTTTATSICW